MRGQQSFSNLFETTTKRVAAEPRPRNYYMPERNLHLAHRYYYYAEIKFLRYDKCLQLLEKEFYLTEARLIVVLSDCTEVVRELVATKPTTKELQQKIPHFNW